LEKLIGSKGHPVGHVPDIHLDGLGSTPASGLTCQKFYITSCIIKIEKNVLY